MSSTTTTTEATATTTFPTDPEKDYSEQTRSILSTPTQDHSTETTTSSRDVELIPKTTVQSDFNEFSDSDTDETTANTVTARNDSDDVELDAAAGKQTPSTSTATTPFFDSAENEVNFVDLGAISIWHHT
ncbi:unnamed protein product [Notodromas monacha]|uniref:Uncharacterized protein n=1 Tax=Notodromas monacha TaxID=399045 RepID=A0A7R9BHE0_9CRUS|nr:unnamed protein product [Notodromas monacha]CAG0915525.1 unnamed protein product [Notodromas monacha]